MSPSALTSPRRAPGGKDYGYGNARVRGMRSRLFDRQFFDRLVEADDLGWIIQELSTTPYGPDLEEVLIHGRTAAIVDEALKNNMVRAYRKVLGVVNDEAHDLVTTLLGRWDLFNLKTIVRGKHVRLTREEIAESVLPVAQLSATDLAGLAALEDVHAVVDTLATWGLPFASALRRGYVEYARTGELADLELFLDTYYAEWAAERLSGKGGNAELARKILGIQVDIINLLTVFRMLKADVEGFDVQRYFLAGGATIQLDLFKELAALSDVDEVLDRLRGTPYGHALEDAAVAYLEGGSLSVFERALEDHLVRRAVGASLSDPLGIGVIVSYLWAKQNEVTNLRIVVKGTAVGMPTERMKRELILV